MHGQSEGLVIDPESQHPQQQQQGESDTVLQYTTERGSAARTDGGFTDENLVPPVGNYDDVRLKDTLQPVVRMSLRATSAVPGRAHFGLVMVFLSLYNLV